MLVIDRRFRDEMQDALQSRLCYSECLVDANGSSVLIVVERTVHAQSLLVFVFGSREDISVSRSRNGKAWCRNKNSAWRTVDTTSVPAGVAVADSSGSTYQAVQIAIELFSVWAPGLLRQSWQMAPTRWRIEF